MSSKSETVRNWNSSMASKSAGVETDTCQWLATVSNWHSSANCNCTKYHLLGPAQCELCIDRLVYSQPFGLMFQLCIVGGLCMTSDWSILFYDQWLIHTLYDQWLIHTFLWPVTDPYFVWPVTDPYFVWPVTDPYFVWPVTDPYFVWPVTDPYFVWPVTDPYFVWPVTDPYFVWPVTDPYFVWPVTDQLLLASCKFNTLN